MYFRFAHKLYIDSAMDQRVETTFCPIIYNTLITSTLQINHLRE